jgi:hypothetical protein
LLQAEQIIFFTLNGKAKWSGSIKIQKLSLSQLEINHMIHVPTANTQM